MHMHTRTHTRRHYSATNKKDVFPSVTTGVDLDGVMLSEVSQTKTNAL